MAFPFNSRCECLSHMLPFKNSLSRRGRTLLMADTVMQTIMQDRICSEHRRNLQDDPSY